MTELVVRLSVSAFLARVHELPPVSRWRFGSPCRFVRSIDLLVHVLIPELIAHRAPRMADYLRSTSPRWGRTWRSW